MKDVSKKLTVVNTDVNQNSISENKSLPSTGNGVIIQGSNGAWLPKDVWDSVFEVKSFEDGRTYLYGRLPLVLQYGVSTYSFLDAVEILSIAESLPFDGSTIKYNTETGLIEVIGGGTGGGAAGSIHWDNIEGKPDFTGYAKTEDLKGFVKTDGTTTIAGLQKFTKGLHGVGWKLSHFDNGNPYLAFANDLSWLITQYGTEKMEIGNSNAPLTVYKNGNVEICGSGVVNGNLLVKGGLTFYSTNGSVTPFLIDVTSVDKITSTSTTQVYTANAVRLLKEELARAKAKADTCETNLNTLKSTIETALSGISGSSNASAIGSALKKLCDNI